MRRAAELGGEAASVLVEAALLAGTAPTTERTRAGAAPHRRPRPVRRVGRTVAAAFLWLIALVSVLVFAALAVGPRAGRYRTMVVLTGSMRPFMPAGSLVVVVPVPLDQVRVGDVIAFTAPIDGSPTISHRVVEIVERGANPVVRTKGDANDRPDAWRARLVGDKAWRVSRVFPRVGWAVHWLRTVPDRRVIVAVVPFLLAGWWLLAIWSPPGDRRDPDDPDDPDAPEHTFPTDGAHARRRPRHAARRRSRRRAVVVAGTLIMAMAVGTTPAWASFNKAVTATQPQGYRTTTLTPPVQATPVCAGSGLGLDVNLSWTPQTSDNYVQKVPANSFSYDVYRSTGGAYSKIGSSATNGYTDSLGILGLGTYSYKITPKFGSWTTASFSNVQSVTVVSLLFIGLSCS